VKPFGLHRRLDRPKAETEGVNAPPYHPGRPSRQHRSDGNIFGRPGRGVPTFYLFIRPPCPLRPVGAPPPKGGGFIYGSIRESTLPQLFIIHQRSGFIIQYSFVPPHHPICPFRQHCAKGDVCGRTQFAPTCQCAVVRYCSKFSLHLIRPCGAPSPARGRLLACACKDVMVLKIKARTQGSLSEGAGSAKGRD